MTGVGDAVVLVVLWEPVSGENPTAMKMAIAEKITRATAPTANSSLGLIARSVTTSSLPDTVSS